MVQVAGDKIVGMRAISGRSDGKKGIGDGSCVQGTVSLKLCSG